MMPSVFRATGACFTVFMLVACAAFITSPALGDPLPGDPGRNVNLIGPTPDPADIRDTGLKQQNEPACAVRPGNPACVICGYNDYRTVEKPVDALGNPIIGDAWQGISMSCDVGTSDIWRSRVAPGHPADDPLYRIEGQFAADPRLIALPGMTLFNFITGFREDNRGTLAVQHWLEVNREDADPYEPAARTAIVDLGTDGRFIDKPDMLALLDPPASQQQISLSFEMENPELGTITRDFPSGDVLFAYAVFTGGGNNSVKVLVKSCEDWGLSCPNQVTKLSEDQNLVSGISLTAVGDSVMAVWRRRGDNNDPDAIMWAASNNRGKKWTKAESLPLCEFDMASFTSGEYVTFRTNDFPWVANDGERFYLFYSDRSVEGTCETGRPRIVMRTAAPGGNVRWSEATPVDDSFEAGQGFQLMPTAFGARGKIQVAWYDTRREILPAPKPGTQVFRDQFVADYPDFIAGRAVVNRKLDIYTARIQWNESADAPDISPAVRVSRYRLAAEGDSGTIASPAIEGEASFANVKAYESGTKAFVGDYLAMAAPEFRQRSDGKWESNASPVAVEPNDVDFFVAWTDQRDMRGEILPEILQERVPFQSSGNSVADVVEHDEPAAEKELLADFHSPSGPPRDLSKTAEGIVGTEDPADGVCVPGDPQIRTRDANIYGALIRDRVRLYAPTPTKPLSGLQRTFPVGLTNRNESEQTYRLEIANQPCADPLVCRASWRQKPAGPLFQATDPAPVTTTILTVPPKSTLARTLFMVAEDESGQVRVNVVDATCGEATCPILASVVLGGTNTGTAGQLRQPEYDASPVCGTDTDGNELTDEARAACFSNLENELHNPELLNPELANPELVNPDLANPELANPELLNPELANPELLNPELLNPELANLGFQNPELANPELANPELANPELLNPELANPELANPELANPELANPELANPELANSTLDEGVTWTDYTYAIRNTGNVTTAFNADLAVSGPAAGDVDSQLIAYTIHLVPTARGCNYVAQYEKQVLATINNPDDDLDVATIEDPFNGGISALAAPGQTIFFTRRIFGTVEELANVTVSGFTASSQAANCSEENLDDSPEKAYQCQETLVTDQELIVLDTAPPVFDGVADGDVFTFEAEGPEGACADLVASGAIRATDNGEPATVICTAPGGAVVCDSGDPQGSPFLIPLDTPTDITCTATDGAGNVASVDVILEVRDFSAPFFADFPADTVSVNAGPEGTAVVDLNSYVTAADVDGVDPAPLVECTTDTGAASGDALFADSYDVTCTATDASGNTDPANNVTYTLSVADVTPPTIALTGADPQIIEAGSDYTELGATASDAVDGDLTGSIVIGTSSVDTATVGLYTVTYDVSDSAGNAAVTVTRTVDVRDTTAPVITLLGDKPQTIEAATPYVELGATASDVGDGDLSASIVINSMAVNTGVVGSYSVTYDVTDASGNAAVQQVRTVTVVDTTAPVISLLGDNPLTVEAGPDYTDPGALANDTLDGNITAAVVIDDSAVLPDVPDPLGYLVYFNVSDSRNNAAPTVTRTVIVVDTTAPTILGQPLPDVTAAITSGTSVAVTYATPAASDNAREEATVTCDPASGSAFTLGTSPVTCTAADASGNTATAGFDVVVSDGVAPTIAVTDPLIAVARDASGTTVDFLDAVTVSDNIDDPAALRLTCSPESGTLFPFGDTDVDCTVTDSGGNSATASFTVQVRYGDAYGIEFSKGNIQAGSTVPLEFGWRDSFGNLMDSSAADPVVTARDCATGNVVLNPGEFPGNSDLRWDASQNTWKFNWQTVFPDGAPLPAEKKGTDYCVQVESRRTGQTIPADGFTVITLKD